jgi:hypothetical protein
VLVGQRPQVSHSVVHEIAFFAMQLIHGWQSGPPTSLRRQAITLWLTSDHVASIGVVFARVNGGSRSILTLAGAPPVTAGKPELPGKIQAGSITCDWCCPTKRSGCKQLDALP